ncbi:biotin transporter BioY [Mycolicibacterium bacteremicum]|uniref:biotin transporter BioY n=1 Tax=Mycolicibacterium bacteremicum TaxID=564198 RepID=UPI001A982210|nr:biotin transporter BioY [Mycolicibacterium bacteremicum]MCV7433395.1 biotin transporter BioY [Mycolicibacterium bacteremicum]
MSAQTSPPRRFGRLESGDLTQAAVFAGLLAALGLPGTLTIGPSGVPITLQTLGVMLAGSILGPRKGALAVALFAVLAIAGLPILAGGRTGLVSLSSPTAGFFVGWLPAVIVIGVLTALMMPRYRVLWGIGINIVGGMAVIYLFGTAGLMLRTDLSWWAALSTNGIYLPGDIAKAVLCGVVAAQVHRARPGLITPWRRRAGASAATEDPQGRG